MPHRSILDLRLANKRRGIRYLLCPPYASSSHITQCLWDFLMDISIIVMLDSTVKFKYNTCF